MAGISKAAKPELAQMCEALRAIVGEGGVRRGVNADGVCGVFPALCVEPADEAELSRVLQYANDAELMVSPRGGGTKLEWGTAPSGMDLAISTARFNRILDYAPSDMTVTAGAGVSIAQLQSTLATHGQRLALDPLWPQRATVGGVIAANDSGALRVRYGGVRDLMIGATAVLADGTIAASGGKVVKNVAGYDLPKLMAGALGTLGILTRAVFRLHPLPESSQTLTWTFADCEPAKNFILAIADSQTVPSGVQMRTGGFPSGADESTYVDVRIDGIAAGIEAQMRTVRELARDVRPTEPEADPWPMREQLWSATSEAGSSCILKLSVLPAQLASVAEFVRSSLGNSRWKLLMHSTGLGWLRIDFAQDNSAECSRVVEFISVLRALLAPTAGSAVVLRGPSDLREKIDIWGDAVSALSLMVRLKEQFDPRGILNRGRFVGGI
jgi:glycolate dehydrogenase FAD-binding subunit